MIAARAISPVRGWRSALSQARALAVVLVAALLGACGTPTSPTPDPPPPVTPPVVTAPVINSISVAAATTEIDRDVAVLADVTDAEKAPSALTYLWSANVGVVSGTGMAVTWRLASGAVQTPVNVTISLTVVEPYQALENGQLVNREHRVTRAAAPVRVHDSKAEISRMVRTFLVDYFGNISVSPDACLVDFSDTCAGKADEHDNIAANRRDYSELLEVRLDAVNVTVGGFGTADVVAPCLFRSRRKSGEREAFYGDCELSAVYHLQRWWLCTSHFTNYVAVPASFTGSVPRSVRWGTTSVPGTFRVHIQ